MPRGVPSVSNPTNNPLDAPSENCPNPISAEALPACAACRESAPTDVLALLKPWQLNARKIGATINGRICTPLNARTVRVAVAQNDTRQINRNMNDRPKRGSMRALICDPAINPQAHSPNVTPKPDGYMPKPWMNTGADPAR